MVDFGRRAYKTACRFLRDDDTVSEIRWVEARPDAPVLGRTSGIYSLDDECDSWLPWPLGEVEGAPRPFTGQRAPIGLDGDHVCGTDEEFEYGGRRDEELPPVRYGAAGFPLCCDPPRLARGGAGASGRAVYHLVGLHKMRGGAGASGRAVFSITPGLHLYGGAGASGRAVVSVTVGPHLYGGAGAGGRADFLPSPFIEPTEGGYAFGGEAGEEYTPGYPVAGGTCADSAEIELDFEYTYTLAPGQAAWFKITIVAGTQYVLRTPGFGLPLTLLTFLGGVCPLPSVLPTTSHGEECRDFTAPASGVMRLYFQAYVDPGLIQFKLSEGVCT